MSENKPEKKTETRIMRVTLPKEEFEKYDKGITHSNYGLRKESGALSALPDIAPIEKDELPQRTVILQPKAPSIGQLILRDCLEIIIENGIIYFSDPQKREKLISAARQFWNDTIKPLWAEHKEKNDKWYVTKAERILAETKQDSDISYQVETVNEHNEKIVVKGEQAEQLVNAMRKSAKELSAMIFLLSKIVIKDEKSDSVFLLQDTFIRQLLSEEVTNSMQTLLSNRQLLDSEIMDCFEDWLNGYIKTDSQRITLPELTAGSDV